MYVFPVDHKFRQYRHFVDISSHFQTFGPVRMQNYSERANPLNIWLYAFDWERPIITLLLAQDKIIEKLHIHGCFERDSNPQFQWSQSGSMLNNGVSAHFKACIYAGGEGTMGKSVWSLSRVSFEPTFVAWFL
jgi:hypothetical protein